MFAATCESCPSFQGPAGDGMGECRLAPQVVYKAKFDWCSEHPWRHNSMRPLTYSKESGFDRPPSLAEARVFAIDKPSGQAEK
jgi:hypothetical protein